MRDRRIILFLLITIIFGIGVIIWYFFGSSTTPSNPSITTPSNPFGKIFSQPRSEFINSSTSQTDTSTETEYTNAEDRSLFQIWNKPVAGYAFITREILQQASTTNATTSKKTVQKPNKKIVSYIIFTDRITGFIYGYNKETHTVFQITNTTLPGVYDAYFVFNGSRALMRTLDKDGITIHTTSVTLPAFVEGLDPRPVTSKTELQNNITSIAANSTSSYSYLATNTLGATLFTVNVSGDVKVTYTPFKEWALSYGGSIPYISTKPSAYIEGNIVNSLNNETLIGGKTGLMGTQNMLGDSFASMWGRQGLASFIFKKTTAEVLPLSIKTLASKCAWVSSIRVLCGVPTELPATPTQGLPDEWFQGNVTFSDNLYMVNTVNNLGTLEAHEALLYDLSEETGSPFDVVKPLANEGESSLIFTNRNDGTLWLADLSKMIKEEN